MTRDEMERAKAAAVLGREAGKVVACLVGISALLGILFGIWVSWRGAATLFILFGILALFCVAVKRSEKVAELRDKLGLR